MTRPGDLSKILPAAHSGLRGPLAGLRPRPFPFPSGGRTPGVRADERRRADGRRRGTLARAAGPFATGGGR